MSFVDLDIEAFFQELEIEVVVPASAEDRGVSAQLLQLRLQLCVPQSCLELRQVCGCIERVFQLCRLRWLELSKGKDRRLG